MNLTFFNDDVVFWLDPDSSCLYKPRYYTFFYKKLVYKKRVLGRSKNYAALVLCSTEIKKLCNINLSKKE